MARTGRLPLLIQSNLAPIQAIESESESESESEFLESLHPPSPRGTLACEVDKKHLLDTESIESEKRRSRRRYTTIKLLIYLVGLSEGLTHLAALALYYLFKDDLALQPSQTSALLVVPSLPWFFKPAFAFLSDTTPICGMRRKPYLIIFSLVECLGYLCLAACPAKGFILIPVALLLVSLGAAFCSAMIEALVVEMTNIRTADTAQRTRGGTGGSGGSVDDSVHGAAAAVTSVTELIGAKAVGSLVVAYLSGSLLEYYSKTSIFLITAIFPLVITVASIFMVDRGEPPVLSASLQFSILTTFLSQKIVWGPIVFILLYMGGPDYDDALFYFYTSVLNFSPSFMGTLRFTYGIAALMGIFVYRVWLSRVSYRSIMTYTILVALPIYISPIVVVSGYNQKLGISDKAFVLSGGFLTEAVAELQLLPLLVYAALICPPGLEASVYSVIMSVRNLGSAISKATSSVSIVIVGITATNFDHLSQFIFVCGVVGLLPLFFVFLIPTQQTIAKVRQENSVALQTHTVPPLMKHKPKLWARIQQETRTRP